MEMENMDKQALVLRIEQMPSFILRDVAINGEYSADATVSIVPSFEMNPDWKAVTETNLKRPLAFVSKKYKLIQFKDVFLPIIANVTALDGNLIYYEGFSYMTFFPDDINLSTPNGKIGIVAVNSVNKMSSVIMKFCLLHNGKLISVPEKLAGFKRVHAGKVMDYAQNFIMVVDKIKDIWATVITHFSTQMMSKDFAISVLDVCEIQQDFLREKSLEYVETHANMNLWDFFLFLMDLIESKTSYTSDIHKRKKLDSITEKIFQYAITTKLIHA
jgi:hypothetical protein